MRTPLLSIAALAAVLLLPRAASATSTFPGEVKKHLGLSRPPDCTLCHATSEGGSGTATKPFAVTMKSRGLVAGDLGSLDTALDALAAEGKDSDKDGVPDIEELKADTDPNAGPGGAEASTAEPVYGCIGRVAGGQGESGLLALVAALATAAALRRQARRLSRRLISSYRPWRRARWPAFGFLWRFSGDCRPRGGLARGLKKPRGQLARPAP